MPREWGVSLVDPALAAIRDARFMRDALELGRRGLGNTWPNPAVGAVIVREEGGEPRIVGRGWTQPGGRPHAEAMAFERAGPAAFGATMYVTLEPCAHRSVRGATPCVERTMLSGVSRVVSALDDPNPHTAGLGHALLRSFGVAVSVGEGAAEARRDNRGHILRVTEGRPMVTLKLALTADGFAAGAGQERLIITGPETQAFVHALRARHDAILCGVETVLHDDPRLDVRLPGLQARSPARVVLDTRLRLLAASRLARAARERRLMVVAGEHAPLAAERELAALGVEVHRVGLDPSGRVDPREALRLLALRGLTRVFCEGGPTLAEALSRASLIDEVLIVTSGKRLDAPGLPALGTHLAGALAGKAFAHLESAMIGADRLDHFERAK